MNEKAINKVKCDCQLVIFCGQKQEWTLKRISDRSEEKAHCKSDHNTERFLFWKYVFIDTGQHWVGYTVLCWVIPDQVMSHLSEVHSK